MTEFYNVGKHCDHATCHQRDFLPFTCELCKKTLCLEHRDFADHSCIKIEEQLAESTVPVCPVCDKPVSKKYPTEDNNIVISRHWDNGECSNKAKPKKSNKLRCHHAGCNQSKLLLDCKSCQQSYCLTHRLQEDHTCVAKTNTMATTLRSIHREREIKKLYNEFKVQPIRNKKSYIKKRRPVDVVEFSNSWSTSITSGPDKLNMEESNKVYVSVYLPQDSKIQPLKMYFDTKWSIGKALDSLSDFVNISNHNNKLPEDSEQRLNLYFLNAKEIHPLNNSITFGELVLNEIIRNKETTLVLERGPVGRSHTLKSDFLVKDIPPSRCSSSSNVKMFVNKLINV